MNPPASNESRVDPVRDRDRGGVGILPAEECTTLLRRTEIGRMAFQAGGQPMVLPVNYLFTGGAIVFRTAPGSKLHAAIVDAPVAFEIDAWDSASRTGWSVLARGVAQRVTDPEEVANYAKLGLYPWADATPRAFWVRIQPNELSGRLVGWDPS